MTLSMNEWLHGYSKSWERSSDGLKGVLGVVDFAENVVNNLTTDDAARSRQIDAFSIGNLFQ